MGITDGKSIGSVTNAGNAKNTDGSGGILSENPAQTTDASGDNSAQVDANAAQMTTIAIAGSAGAG